MFTTNLMLLMPVIGVAAGLVAAMLVVRARDLRLAPLAFNARNSRVLVPQYTKEGVMIAMAIPLTILLFGCSVLMVHDYLKPTIVTITDTGPVIEINIKDMGPPPRIDDRATEQDNNGTFTQHPFGRGVPKPVADNLVPDSADLDPTRNWASLGNIDPRILKSDSVRIVRDGDIPSKGYVELAKVPELVRQIDPVYPSIMVKAGGQGRTYVIALLDVDGHVIKVELSRSSGYPALDEAALDAVKQWVFTPAIAPDGRPTRVWQMCPISFKLAN